MKNDSTNLQCRVIETRHKQFWRPFKVSFQICIRPAYYVM